MKPPKALILIAMLAGSVAPATAQESKRQCHLFILSGQSNMAGLKPEISFTPTVAKAFEGSEVIVVKDAAGGQPIRRWYKKWAPADEKANYGDLYDRLMKKVKAEVGEKQPDSVTFVWMQGEKDAREKNGEVYAAAFRGLRDQLKADLGREDINFVIGRLSDFDNDNKRYPHWTKLREVQAELAESDPRGEWVDTDDLNGKGDGLHYDKEGYRILGERFAEKAIALVRGPQPKKD